ncbi:MAG: hypothetical protein R6U15_07555 [Candidatus Izemoplasmatales bacterium]
MMPKAVKINAKYIYWGFKYFNKTKGMDNINAMKFAKVKLPAADLLSTTPPLLKVVIKVINQIHKRITGNNNPPVKSETYPTTPTRSCEFVAFGISYIVGIFL